MNNKLFVGGFPYRIDPDELKSRFASCGTVLDVRLIMDRETGRPKGFGFVTMSTPEEAAAAAAKLNGAEVGGRKLFVTVAREEKRAEGPAAKPAFAAAPGFVERRSGKDRRKAAAPGGERREAPAPERKWEKKPWEKKPGDRKPWDKKPGDKKPWDKKPGDKKPWAKKPGDAKPWDKRPARKPWEAPAGVEGGKRWEKRPVPLRPKGAGGSGRGS